MRAAVIESGVVANVIEVESCDALPGVHLVEAETASIGDIWDGQSFATPLPPAKSAEELREEFKIARAAAVAAIVVEVEGMHFDGDETSQGRMARAILAMEAAAVSETTWVLADNEAHTVTRAQLQQALVAAGLAQSALWIAA